MKRGERIVISGIRWECVGKRRAKAGEWVTFLMRAGDKTWYAQPWVCSYKTDQPLIILRPVSVVRAKRKVRER